VVFAPSGLWLSSRLESGQTRNKENTMPSAVYFIDLKASFKENLPRKIRRLMETAGIADVVSKRDLAAVKIHFGEKGNTAFIRPVFVRTIIDTLKQAGAVPFLTDANTLYAGTRGDAVNHTTTAVQNGFAYSVVEAPIVIADGLRGKSESAVPVNGKHFEKVYIGREIVEADALLSVAHFKGHELTGFGGAIKNIGMGSASRRGKMAQHSGIGPKIKRKKCVGCGDCVSHCAHGAIAMHDKKAAIDPEKCIGCGECILICSSEAVQIQWTQSGPAFLEKMVEYTQGVLRGKEDKTLCINFITNVSPACDCFPFNDRPIVRDIGILASTDPVAIDQASVDLVNREPAIPDSCLTTNTAAGEDKFRGIYPKVDWEAQLDYAQHLGIGNREYELVKL
jgi:uncharacterized Fe-S center protein